MQKYDEAPLFSNKNVFYMGLATLLDGAGYLFSQAKFFLLKSFYGVLSVKVGKKNG